MFINRECENYKDGEKQEMVELYMRKGIPEQDAKTVVYIISRDNVYQFHQAAIALHLRTQPRVSPQETFVDIMMVEELGIMPPDEDDAPWKNGAP